MAKLITTDEQLRAHLPNIIASVKGETPLIEKLSLFLDLAEGWVKSTFTSESTFNTICGYTDSNIIKTLTARLVVAEAMYRAIPALDVVLTPNGFGIVSTNNLTPASKHRVDRLSDAMLAHRDDCIAALLPELVGASKWLSSSQASFFSGTLFPDLAIIDALGGASGSRWEKYLEVRSQVIDLEASLAEEWFSPNLMDEFRAENLRGSDGGTRSIVIAQIKAQITGYLVSGSFNTRRLMDIVNVIRSDYDNFSSWHLSETANLFAPPTFRNSKSAKGYWF